MTDTETPGDRAVRALHAVLAMAEDAIGRDVVVQHVQDEYDLHHMDDCDHDECCDGSHPDVEYLELPRDELERAARDHHDGQGLRVGPGAHRHRLGHGVGGFETCTDQMCVTLARVLGKRYQGDDL